MIFTSELQLWLQWHKYPLLIASPAYLRRDGIALIIEISSKLPMSLIRQMTENNKQIIEFDD
jgi:hypothetical protein